MRNPFRGRGDQTPDTALEDTRMASDIASPEDTGAHLEQTATPERCRACLGTGQVLRTADLLRLSLTLFPDDAAQKDAFVAAFYQRLVDRDAGKSLGDRLAPLFPPDLTTGDALNSKGHRQRDMLLNAIISLGKIYDPDRPDSPDMRHLKDLLHKWGRDHASFRRPDGTERAATRAEYEEVWAVLAGLLHETFTDRWVPEFDIVWAEAYDFAEIEMRKAAQEFRAGRALYGRTPRRAQ